MYTESVDKLLINDDFLRDESPNLSSVYGVRIPKRLKNDIEKMSNVDWQNETRKFLEKKVRRERLAIQLERARELRKKSSKTISVADLIREDRSHAH